MSMLLDIIQRIQDTQEAIRKTKEILLLYPKDLGLLANLKSLEIRALSLEASFLDEANVEHLDIVTYRMFAEKKKFYSVMDIGSALTDLQRWFSTVYDSLKTGPKRKAKLSPEIISATTLDFAFSFSGSVGIAMSIPSERLLLDNELQVTIKKTIEMAKAESSDQIHSFSKEMGASSIRAMYRWVQDHISAGAGAEIRWIKNEQEVIAASFEAKHLANLGHAIEETSDNFEEEIKVTGSLVGADVTKHTFHMVFDEADEIRGTMAETIGSQYTVELPKRYVAIMRKTSYLNYATDEEHIKHHLLELKDE